MRLKPFVTSCLLLILLGLAAPAAALNFNAFWLYRVAGGEDRDTRTEYQQRYSLGVGPQLDWRPTHAISASANVSYNQSQRDSGDGFEDSERLSTAARLNLVNDIFTSSLSGSASRARRDSEWGDVGRSWGATLASAWDIPLWPNLNLNYSEQPSSVDSSRELFAEPDRLQKTAAAAVDWDLLLADLSYRYTQSWDEDRISGNRSDGNSHFARVATNGRLLADRFSYRFSQQYEQSQQVGLTFGEWSLKGSSSAKQLDGGGTNPDDADDTGGGDPEIFGYQDPDRGLPLEVAPLNRIHVAFAEDTGFDQQVNLIRLVFEDAGARQAPLSWELYQRSSELDLWQRVGVVVGQFDVDDRIDIPVNIITREILLVSQQAVVVPLTLLSIRVYTLFEGGDNALTASESTNTSWLTNAGVGFTLTRTISASVNMTLEQRENQGSNSLGFEAEDTTRVTGELERLSLGGRLQWRPLDWLSSSIGVSQTQETNESTSFSLMDERRVEEERTSRSYSWALLTRPMDTVSVTFGVTRNESEANASARINTGSGWQYSLSTTARIYPDLNAAVFLTYSDRISETKTEGRTRTTDTGSYGARMNLDARLTRTLSADMSLSYRHTDTLSKLVVDDGPNPDDSDETADTAGVTLNMNYRPSNYLSLRGFYATSFLDSNQPDSFGARMTVALLQTDRARLTLNYSFTYSEQATNSLSVNGSWDISNRMSLRSRANYVIAQTHFYALETTLSFRL